MSFAEVVDLVSQAKAWIAQDPDADTRFELEALSSCQSSRLKESLRKLLSMSRPKISFLDGINVSSSRSVLTPYLNDLVS